MVTTNSENSKEILSHDPHSVLNMDDRALEGKVEESTLWNFLRKYSYILFLLVIFLAGFFLINKAPQNIAPEDIQFVKIAGQKIKVDLALTPAEQNQGLSGRSPLAENEGMLFVFDKPGKYQFWMKDMNFPIDMIWLAGEHTNDLKVVYIKKNALPELYPETYGPEIDASYVLEVVSGFAEKNNLQIGDRVEFQ